jgi:hypothetical protein
MANLLPFALVGVVIAVAIAGAGDETPTGNGGGDGGPKPGPGKSVLQGGEVVSRGFKSNAYGVKVSFQIERVAGGVEGDGGGEFFGVIFEPWAQNNPTVVAQGATRNEARDKTVAHINADEHGAPG